MNKEATMRFIPALSPEASHLLSCLGIEQYIVVVSFLRFVACAVQHEVQHAANNGRMKIQNTINVINIFLDTIR